MPSWYPCLEMRCDDRVLQTVQVKVNSYAGTLSRSSRDSGAVVEVFAPGPALELVDSQRTAAGIGIHRGTRGAILVGSAVRGGWKSRWDAGMRGGMEAARRGLDAVASRLSRDGTERMLSTNYAVGESSGDQTRWMGKKLLPRHMSRAAGGDVSHVQ